MPAQATAVSMSAYEEATESYVGFCVHCRAFTTSCCEPDAHGYKCEECGKNGVYGAEEALLMELISISLDGEHEDFDEDYLD